ncbi:MAG TPA: tRNA pseudouridine(55) synthase TruB [Oceanithermus profundus]|uniref:tRNA pseudouridine synthase B n=1 Tax=Oceanithermus profundus TaxID=187137 RepID=A0A7C4Z582_9DEIN|nr:tRNA pseudouridine(55) synthase TruB [Oceanithermus profundus]
MAVYAVYKPLGATSHDVVEVARRTLGTKKVGHTGTLDPLATGVLVLATGSHTKLVPFLTGEDKEYLAWISFGATTPTLDAEGPLEPAAPWEPDEAALKRALADFLELEEQVPPAFSAVKVGGVKAYEAARRGEALALEPRPVRYHQVELLALQDRPQPLRIAPGAEGWRPDPRGRAVELPPPLAPLPTAVVRLVVGSGTYVRAFARDLGQALGTGAFLSGLVRTRVGRVGLGQTVPVEELGKARPLAAAEVLPFPAVELDHTEVRRVQGGVPLPIPARGLVALTDRQGRLVAVAEGDGFKLKVRRVFRPED